MSSLYRRSMRSPAGVASAAAGGAGGGVGGDAFSDSLAAAVSVAPLRRVRP